MQWTLRSMVLSPWVAMSALLTDPGAARKGLILVIVVQLASIAIGLAYPLTEPVYVIVLNAIGVPASIAAGAAVLQLATGTGSYPSAFGRVSFAVQLPGAISLVLDAITLLLNPEGDQELLGLLSGLAVVGVLVWTLALLFIAARVGHAGRAAAGCVSVLSFTVFLIVTVVLVIVVTGGLFGVDGS
jgi:hypothetical protein